MDFFYKQLVKNFGNEKASILYKILKAGHAGRGLIHMANQKRLKINLTNDSSHCEYYNDILMIQHGTKRLNFDVLFELNNYKNRNKFIEAENAADKLLGKLSLDALRNGKLMHAYAKKYAYNYFSVEMLSNMDTGRVFKDCQEKYPKLKFGYCTLSVIKDFENLCTGKTSINQLTRIRIAQKWSRYAAGTSVNSHEELYMLRFLQNVRERIPAKPRAEKKANRRTNPRR